MAACRWRIIRIKIVTLRTFFFGSWVHHSNSDDIIGNKMQVYVRLRRIVMFTVNNSVKNQRQIVWISLAPFRWANVSVYVDTAVNNTFCTIMMNVAPCPRKDSISSLADEWTFGHFGQSYSRSMTFLYAWRKMDMFTCICRVWIQIMLNVCVWESISGRFDHA